DAPRACRRAPGARAPRPRAARAGHRRERTARPKAGDGPPLKDIELARLTRRLAVQESARPASVEAQHPVPDDLNPDAADLSRLGARRTVIDRRKRQKPPALRTVVGSPSQTPQLRPI